jgi:hypothetical protein
MYKVELMSEKKGGACPCCIGWEIAQLPHCLMLTIRVQSRKLFHLAPTKILARDHAGEQVFRHRLTPVQVTQRGVQTVIEIANGAENAPYRGE